MISEPEWHEVHVWRVPLSLAERSAAGLEGYLNEEERRRAAQFRFRADRLRHVISRGALRMILARYVNRLPQDLEFSYGATGKPYLAPSTAGRKLHFNLSHCVDLTLVAVSQTRQLGVDVERIRNLSEIPSIIERYLSPEERQFVESAGAGLHVAPFFRLWTRREATAKAMGLDLTAALSYTGIPVYAPDGGARFDAQGPPGESARTWCLKDLPLDPGHMGALCIEGNCCAIVSHDFEATLAV